MATDPTAADLARWEGLAAATTAGPWTVHHVDDAYSRGATYVGTSGDTDLVAGEIEYGQVVAITLLQGPRLACHDSARWDEDAAFIAASRQAVPALVAALRDLARAIVEKDPAYDDGFCGWCGEIDDHTPACLFSRARALLGDAA